MSSASICVICVTCLVLLAQPTLAEASTFTDAQIEKILQERVDLYKKSVGIVVGIVDDDGRRVIAYGKTRSEGGQDIDGGSVFEIGSVTKVFTAVLLADMVKRGEVRLEDPVSKFLPEAVVVPEKDGRQITLLDLATQTSGLPPMPDNFSPADPTNPFADYTVVQMYEFLSGYSLTRGVGQQYEYSNFGMGLLGHALALVAEEDYETLVRTRICGPLEMGSTAITLSPNLKNRLATGHNPGLKPVPNWDIPTLAGAGALRSTVDDMLQFVAANLGLVESKLSPVMQETHASRHQTGMPDTEIGLAWHVLKKHGSEIVWHNGGTGGYHSFTGFDRKKRLGVVVLSNASTDIDDIGRHILEPKLPLARLEPPRIRKEVEVAPAVYETYTGEYEVVPQFVVTISSEDGKLFAQATGQPRFQVFPESETEFFYKVVDAQITFAKDESGQVTHLVLHQNGQDIPATRRGVEVKDERATSVATPVLNRYVGDYQLAPGFVITITLKDGQLLAQATGQPAAPIYPESETRFFYKVVDAQIEFRLNKYDEVEGLTLFQAGRELPARKTK
jgi:serine-type D-Ala-D-Ala carboxypeptidase/endopeptidase